MRIGHKRIFSFFRRSASASYDPDAAAWFARTGVRDADKQNYSDFFVLLKNNGSWSKIRSLYCNISGLTPGAYDMKTLIQRTYVNGNPTYLSNLGAFSYDGVSQYANSQQKMSDFSGVDADTNSCLYTKIYGPGSSETNRGCLQGSRSTSTKNYVLAFACDGLGTWSNIDDGKIGCQNNSLVAQADLGNPYAHYGMYRNAINSLYINVDEAEQDQNTTSETSPNDHGLVQYHMACNNNGTAAGFLGSVWEQFQIVAVDIDKTSFNTIADSCVSLLTAFGLDPS